MELKDQVVSLKLAKKLKELGVKQDSLFYWEEVIDKYGVESKLIYGTKPKNRKGVYKIAGAWEENFYSAFTVPELGDMLPDYLKTKDGYLQLTSYKFPTTWAIVYIKENKIIFSTERDTEANARAKMLIYLIENKLIKL